MVDVPAATPDIIPDEEPIVATDGVEEAHVPPVTELPAVAELPMQMPGTAEMVPAVAEVVTDTLTVDVTVPHTPGTA